MRHHATMHYRANAATDKEYFMSSSTTVTRTICNQQVPVTNIPLIEALIASIPGALLTIRPDGQYNVQLVIPADDAAQYALCEALSEALPAC